MNILNQLTMKHLKMNKKRTIATIIGIILSTALMVGIGTIASTGRDYLLKTLIDDSGPWHATLSEVPKENVKYIENNVQVKNTYISYPIGYAKLEGGINESKPYLYIQAGNNNYLKTSKLKEGRLPENSNELVISDHIYSNGGVEHHVGDQITLKIGKRYLEGNPSDYLTQSNPYDSEEKLTYEMTKTYTIVGIIERRYDENYSAPGYTVLTVPDKTNDVIPNLISVGIEYQKVKDVHKKTEEIAKNVKAPVYEVPSIDNPKKNVLLPMIEYNEDILTLYGESSYDSFNGTFYAIAFLILFLVAAGCAIVIYNSFAISVMERKKQFGLFSSIGATRKQLRKTVYFEALIVGMIGIPIGVLSGMFGIWVVIQVINHLLPGVFVYPLSLSLYPNFIIIPIIYMIITVFISALIPAYRASRISPIEAIRLNDDIKIRSKKVKTSKLTRKLYGVEGELAKKNMKRNRKKYRITILSLVVSIVLFIGFSVFVEYGNNATNDMMALEDYDIRVFYYSEKKESINDVQKKVQSVSGIDSLTMIKDGYDASKYTISIPIDPKQDYTKEHLEFLEKNGDGNIFTKKDLYVNILALDNASYKNYLKKLGLNEEDYMGSTPKLILANTEEYRDFSDQTFHRYQKYNWKSGTKTFLFKTRDSDYTYDNNNNDTTKYLSKEVELPVTVVKEGPDMYEGSSAYYISEEMAQSLEQFFLSSSYQSEDIHHYTFEAVIKAQDYNKVAEELTKILPSDANIYNYANDAVSQRNLIIIIGIFLYGFITLVTLIGVTSVFNTITTSIALRRREFAVLRSVGLSPKGFSKMIRFESLFYGMKALLWGLPISFVVVLLFNRAFSNLGTQALLIPWKSIVICIFAVFVITFLTMVYATRKIKKENIIDTIREENI